MMCSTGNCGATARWMFSDYEDTVLLLCNRCMEVGIDTKLFTPDRVQSVPSREAS